MGERTKITVGENLKRIRKELGFKQYEIAGEDITRNLISLIENDKATLYDNAANIIAKNMNRIMNEKGLNIFIKPEDLLNPERYDARKEADTYIEKLEDIIVKKDFSTKFDNLNEIEALLNHWDLTDKKVRIYELLGDIFYISNNLSKEYYYYFKALEASYDFPNMKGRYKIALKLVYNCIVTGKNEEAINLCNYMLLSQDDISDKTIGILYYNSALANRNLKKIDRCIETLNIAKKHFESDINNNKFLKRVLMLEGDCHFEIDEYPEAIKSYNQALEILEEIDNIDEICVTYINIIQTYMKLDSKDNILKYFDKVMLKLPYINEDSFYLPEIYFEVSNIYSYLENYNECEKYLETAIALGKKKGNTSLYKKYLSTLVELYIKANWIEKLNDLISNLQDEINNINLSEEFTLILKLLLYFIKQNNHKAADDLITNLIQEKKGV